MSQLLRSLSCALFALSIAVSGCGGGGGGGGGGAASSGGNTSYATERVGPLAQARALHTATRLLDGRILVAGGLVGPNAATAEVELLDPLTGLVQAAAPMGLPRMHHEAVLLPTGKVLVVGGQRDRSGPALRETELYDPQQDSWTPGPDLFFARSRPVLAVYAGGRRVLIAGGVDLAGTNPSVLGTAELYRADSNTIQSSSGVMSSPRCCGEGIALADGRVLLASGYRDIASASPADAEVYDPATDAFSLMPLLDARADAALLRLNDGMHVVGGRGSAGPLDSSERFDGSSWTLGAGLRYPRARHSATFLSGTGETLVLGGRDGARTLLGSERYPVGLPGPTLREGRHTHRAVEADGRIYLVGGFGDGDSLLASVEVVTPTGTTVPGAGASAGVRVSAAVPAGPPPGTRGSTAVAIVSAPTGVAMTPAGASLAVSAVSPQAGQPGDVVQVLGIGFDPTPSNNIVSFAGVQAVVLFVDTSNPGAHSLQCVVPPRAVTGALSIEVAGQVAPGPSFSVGPQPTGPPPRILFVLPNGAAPFVPVSITGRHFGPQPLVTFNGVPTINIINWSSRNLPLIGSVSELVVLVPSGATSGPLVVHNGPLASNPFHFTVR